MFRKKILKLMVKSKWKIYSTKDDILEMFLYDDKFNEFTKEKIFMT